jgi:pSer/pThr/pTyr-binding forkhead associated (FHA) protein
MFTEPFGELVSLTDGERIPLTEPAMTVGRNLSCNIILSFANVSSLHATFTYREGYWHVRDENSTNGTRVNRELVSRRRLNPGDEISFSTHRYAFECRPPKDGEAQGPRIAN